MTCTYTVAMAKRENDEIWARAGIKNLQERVEQYDTATVVRTSYIRTSATVQLRVFKNRPHKQRTSSSYFFARITKLK